MSIPPPSTLLLLQRRTVRVLVVAQLLGALGLAAGGTAGAARAVGSTLELRLLAGSRPNWTLPALRRWADRVQHLFATDSRR